MNSYSYPNITSFSLVKNGQTDYQISHGNQIIPENVCDIFIKNHFFQNENLQVFLNDFFFKSHI